MEEVDAYIAAAPTIHRAILTEIRATILAATPRGTAEILSYGMPAYKYGRVLVWVGAFKAHCSFFPTQGVIARFQTALTGFKTTKGAIHFSAKTPLTADLVTAMVHARVAEVATTVFP